MICFWKLLIDCLMWLKFTWNSRWGWWWRNTWWSSTRWLWQWLLLKWSIAYSIWIIWIYIITFSQISWTESTKFGTIFIISLNSYPKQNLKEKAKNEILIYNFSLFKYLNLGIKWTNSRKSTYFQKKSNKYSLFKVINRKIDNYCLWLR